MMRILFSLLVAFQLQPPTNVALDPAGVSFDAPIAGRYCAQRYAPDWTGDAPTFCQEVVAAGSSGSSRIDLPIALSEHVFLSRIKPFVEIGPFSRVPSFSIWLPIIGHSDAP